MTRDQALESVLAALRALMVTCGEYSDLDTARSAMQAYRDLVALRSPEVVRAMERDLGLG